MGSEMCIRDRLILACLVIPVSFKQVSKILMSMVGEYIVAAYLCSMGYLAAVTPRGMPRADLIVHDLANGRSRLVQVKAFSRRENRCPLIGASATFESIDEVLREKVVYPYIFVELGQDLRKAKFYILAPGDVRKLAKETYIEWLERKSHKKPIEELKKTRQPLCIPIDKLEAFEDKWDNIWKN